MEKTRRLKINWIHYEKIFLCNMVDILSRSTTRSNRRTLAGEPRGRFGGVRGKQPLASSPPSANRTPNLARRLENLTALDFQCCERPLGSTRLPPPLLRKPVRVRGSARRYTAEKPKTNLKAFSPCFFFVY